MSSVALARDWTSELCRSRVTNHGARPVAVKEIVLADLTLDFPPATAIYGEGFQMLSQTGGTLGEPKDLGSYTDAKHYQMPTPPGTQQFYGAMTVSGTELKRQWVAAFTSCRRFSGLFRLRPRHHFRSSSTPKDSTLAPGETWELEELLVGPGLTRDGLLGYVGSRIAANHPPLKTAAPPTGWCSWYCFGPRVTAQQVLDNLDVIAKKIPGLSYVQIDDGYQPRDGRLARDRRGVRRQRAHACSTRSGSAASSRRSGSRRSSPKNSRTSSSSTATGSSRTPTARRCDPIASRSAAGAAVRGTSLDGTHPEVQRALRAACSGRCAQEWGCTYFKLDANFWGAIHGGRFHDPRATRIEAYRRGMQAILRGAGDSFILGCNHPIWPSLGLDPRIAQLERHQAHVGSHRRRPRGRTCCATGRTGGCGGTIRTRSCLTGDLTGRRVPVSRDGDLRDRRDGAVGRRSDDDSAERATRDAEANCCRRPASPRRSRTSTLRVGTVRLPDKRMLCLFNWDDTPQTLVGARSSGAARVTDFWTGESLGRTRVSRDHDRGHAAALGAAAGV